MTTTWDEASKCPRDGAFTGIVRERRRLEGSLSPIVTLVCPETNCPYNADPWIVQIRPDGTIPDAPSAEERRAARGPRMKTSETQAQKVRDMLAEQAANETKPGYEVRGLR